jgi:hypothetical protein
VVVVEQQQPEGSGSNGPKAGGGLSRPASGVLFTDGWQSDDWRSLMEVENTVYEEYETFSESEMEVGGTSRVASTANILEEEGTTYIVVRTRDDIINDADACAKDDSKVVVVDGERYYDCEEAGDEDEDYDYGTDIDDEDVESSDGFELIGMVANSVSSFFW